MEQTLRIRIPKTNYRMEGILRGSLRRPLLVFVHGLTGQMNEHIFYNGARFFEKHGFATFRFNLYDWEKGARKLRDCTIQTHADDLDVVIQYLRGKGAKDISVAGHSYGGPTILQSKNQDFRRAVLWDPTATASFKLYGAKRVKSLDAYMLPGSYDFIVGKQMYEENQKLDAPKLLKRFPIPTRVITTNEPHSHGTYWRKALAKNLGEHAIVTIKGATHCFDEDHVEEKLFIETLTWLK